MNRNTKAVDAKKLLAKLKVPKDIEAQTHTMINAMVNHECYGNSKLVLNHFTYTSGNIIVNF